MPRTLYRGSEIAGLRVEVTFADPMELANLTDGSPFVACACENCGSLVADIERHTDWHYGIAAGRPWGAGSPPGFRP